MENNDEEAKDKINSQSDKKVNDNKKEEFYESRSLSGKENNLLFKRNITRGKTVIDSDFRSSKFSLELVYRQKKEKELLESIANLEDITKENIQLAERIDFKSIPDSIVKTDEYGFLLDENDSNEANNSDKKSNKKEKEKEKEKKENLLKINARIEKWNFMLNNFKEFQTTKLNKLKSRTRKGIPDNLRGYVWQKICGAEAFYVKDLYQKLDNDPMDKEIEEDH